MRSVEIRSLSGRPKTRNVHHSQYPYRVLGKFIDQAVVFVRKKLARPWDEARFPEFRMGGQSFGRLAEQRIHACSSTGVPLDEVVPNCETVLHGLGRPPNPHRPLSARARRAANSASTSSFERPRPARTEARAVSTFWCKNASYSRA